MEVGGILLVLVVLYFMFSSKREQQERIERRETDDRRDASSHVYGEVQQVEDELSKLIDEWVRVTYLRAPSAWLYDLTDAVEDEGDREWCEEARRTWRVAERESWGLGDQWIGPVELGPWLEEHEAHMRELDRKVSTGDNWPGVFDDLRAIEREGRALDRDLDKARSAIADDPPEAVTTQVGRRVDALRRDVRDLRRRFDAIVEARELD